MRRMTTEKEAKVLQAMELTNDTNMTIGTNLTVDGAIVADNIPSTAELENGTYVLKVTIADGVPTFEWVAE